MKREKILTALENIDPAYIEGAANYRAEHSAGNRFLKWGTLAAGFVILLLTGAFLLKPVPPVDSVYWSEPNIEQGVLEKRKLSVINDPAYENYSALRVVDPAYVGEKLGDTEVKSFWRNYLYGEDTDVEFLRAEIYAIRGISPEIAVCIRYLDEGDALTTTHYYTYINTDHKPQSLGDFYRLFAQDRDFSARNGITLSYPSEEGTVHRSYDIDGAVLIRSLSSLVNSETRPVSVWADNDTWENEADILKNCSAQALFYGETPLGGVFSCRIYDNGYLYIRINKSISYVFELSETDSFFRLIDEHKTEKNTGGTVSSESQSSEAVIPE